MKLSFRYSVLDSENIYVEFLCVCDDEINH